MIVPEPVPVFVMLTIYVVGAVVPPPTVTVEVTEALRPSVAIAVALKV